MKSRYILVILISRFLRWYIRKPDGKAAFTSLTRVLIRFCHWSSSNSSGKIYNQTLHYYYPNYSWGLQRFVIAVLYTNCKIFESDEKWTNVFKLIFHIFKAFDQNVKKRFASVCIVASIVWFTMLPYFFWEKRFKSKFLCIIV